LWYPPPPNIRAKPPPSRMLKFGCFDLKTPKNGGGAAGRKKGAGYFI